MTFSNGIIRMISRGTLLRLAITVPALVLPVAAQGQTRPLPSAGAGGIVRGTVLRSGRPHLACEGLDSAVAAFTNGTSIAQTIIAGSIDVGLTGRIQVTNATIRNVPIL